MKQMLPLILLATCAAALPGCNDAAPQDEEVYFGPLLGVWEEITKYADWDNPKYPGNCEGGADGGFDGSIKFTKNGKFQYDGVWLTIDGPRFGFLKGTFRVQSDSVLILNSTDYDTEWLFQMMDTLYFSFLNDTMFVEHASGDPFKCMRYWEKIE